jgi:hypothetical protein
MIKPRPRLVGAGVAVALIGAVWRTTWTAIVTVVVAASGRPDVGLLHTSGSATSTTGADSTGFAVTDDLPAAA